jgi:hypothetical protein
MSNKDIGSCPCSVPPKAGNHLRRDTIGAGAFIVIVMEYDGWMSGHLLVRGVTLPEFDSELASVWLAIAHQVARETGARIIAPVAPPEVAQNYYALPMRFDDGTAHRLMLNVVVGLVGSKYEAPDGVRILDAPFRDVPRPDLFMQAGFVVADRAEMEREVTPADLVDLGPCERGDIAGHKISRLGDVLFNWFD